MGSAYVRSSANVKYVAYCCIIAAATKWDYVSLFLIFKDKFFDSSTLVYNLSILV